MQTAAPKAHVYKVVAVQKLAMPSQQGQGDLALPTFQYTLQDLLSDSRQSVSMLVLQVQHKPLQGPKPSKTFVLSTSTEQTQKMSLVFFCPESTVQVRSLISCTSKSQHPSQGPSAQELYTFAPTEIKIRVKQISSSHAPVYLTDPVSHEVSFYLRLAGFPPNQHMAWYRIGDQAITLERDEELLKQLPEREPEDEEDEKEPELKPAPTPGYPDSLSDVVPDGAKQVVEEDAHEDSRLITWLLSKNQNTLAYLVILFFLCCRVYRVAYPVGG